MGVDKNKVLEYDLHERCCKYSVAHPLGPGPTVPERRASEDPHPPGMLTRSCSTPILAAKAIREVDSLELEAAAT